MHQSALRAVAFSGLFTFAAPFAAAATGEQVIAAGEDAELGRALSEALAAMPARYAPRTEHFLADGRPKYVNRLILEDSPYLRQHAHNPVNWYPWGEEAFERAKRENKPVFLSIGYATCHWCHVMERESFENEEIAERLNRDFVSVKVDREQLPDVDALYMNAVMMLTGRGGWPMSSWLDGQGRTFYAGTYFPPQRFDELLERIGTVWADDNEAVLEQSAQIATAVAEAQSTRGEAREIGEREVARGVQEAIARHDDLLGGFGEAPKFPSESTLLFLLQQALRGGHDDALAAAHFTLRQMADGGIHDQVGGGFHRYATDPNWLVPHFEKMLYNQALLGRAYARGYALTGDIDHARTARRTFDYVLREMTSPEGTFFSATDADSEGAEGTFFVWTREQIDAVLDDQSSVMARVIWNVSPHGNFEDGPNGEARSILHRARPLREIAAEFKLSEAELRERMDGLAERLREARERREPPLLDDKIIVSWNGMLITALVEAAQALGEPRYLDAATRAADALWTTQVRDGGRLWRTRLGKRSSIEGTQSDYAYYAEALLALFDATSEPRWLARAETLVEVMLNQFWDDKDGAFFMGAKTVEGTTLATRPKNLYDNSIPSGNSVGLGVLGQLHRRTGKTHYRDYVDRLIGVMSSRIAGQPTGMMYLLAGVSDHVHGEADGPAYGAHGALRAGARRIGDRMEVTLDIADGWHVNAHEPLQDYLIGTALLDGDGNPVSGASYPKPVQRKLGFERSTLALLEGKTVITAPLPEAPEAGDEYALQRRLAPVRLRLQACDDSVCLPPETLTLNVPVR